VRLGGEAYVLPGTISILSSFIIYLAMIAPEAIPNWQVATIVIIALAAAGFAWSRLLAKRVDVRFGEVHRRIDDRNTEDLVEWAIPKLRRADTETISFLPDIRDRR
jgi:hypothetical protein